MAKERIDIEQLLEWAYRAQCVDRSVASFTPRGPAGSSGNLGQVVALGTRVDNSGFAARALGFRMAGDAMVVHDAVLALGDMWIEWRDGDAVEIWDRDRAEREGRLIEHRRGRWELWHMHWHAEATGRPVLLEQACTTALLIVNAKAGSRPDWHEGWSRPAGAPARDAGPVDRWGRRRKRVEGVSVEDVMHARALYLVWRAALDCLAATLDGALERFDVTGPAAPAAPWENARRVPLRAA